ncbi:hypothetical protein A1O7_08966 [Cladophialophora yegresii CBS 114405]|uniref:Major facilitator superfamily (MFS) profile domain-containing protein n=1 Tax=Cladophialophora yegresii CBS 114405 TaxID=1182544 RepID=W9VSP8_9EURO|nr:uncharacterized protein A1O7_08966 [Cladophialophora yegresii CBS 114405]EXJ56035.1 hypothetical protein A1O7_08966 [Cladophialophora yegresii CBS 114405]
MSTPSDDNPMAMASQSDKEQPHVQHTEDFAASEPTVALFGADSASLPKGYFYSPYFLGSMAACGLSLLGSVGGYALAAPILGIINADIGPNKNIAWVPLMFPVGLAVGQTLLGRISDIFGRRWFFAGGQGFGLIGAIICATARDVPTLIGGSVIVGLAGATALSYPFLIGELVPMKYRFIGTAYACFCCIPFSGLAPAIANSLATRANWRWCYYLMIIFNGLSMGSYLLFYHPPTFGMKHSRKEKLRMIRNFDYIGIFLFTSGMVLFLLGISWGGNVYPWKSAAVIATIVIGALVLTAFFTWEVYHPMEEPLVPMHLFRNRGWLIATLLVSIGASIYYAFGIVWPSMVNVLYAEGDQIYAGWLQCCVGGAFTLGQVTGSFLYKFIGSVRAQLTVTTLIGGALLAGVASASPSDVNLPIGLLIPGNFFIGWMEALTLTLPGMYIRDQNEIGVAVGVAGSVRSALSTLASTIYVTILNNRLAETVPAAVRPAVTTAGLPVSSVPALLAALSLGTPDAFSKVQGLTSPIQEVAINAYKEGNTSAYRTVFFASLAFTGTGILLSLFTPSVDAQMTDSVAVTLHKKKEEKDLENAVQKQLETESTTH